MGTGFHRAWPWRGTVVHVRRGPSWIVRPRERTHAKRAACDDHVERLGRRTGAGLRKAESWTLRDVSPVRRKHINPPVQPTVGWAAGMALPRDATRQAQPAVWGGRARAEGLIARGNRLCKAPKTGGIVNVGRWPAGRSLPENVIAASIRPRNSLTNLSVGGSASRTRCDTGNSLEAKKLRVAPKEGVLGSS